MTRCWRLGPDLSAQAEDPRLCASMEELFGAPESSACTRPWLTLALDRTRLCLNGIPIVALGEDTALTPLLEGVLVGSMVRARSDVSAFHAAAVKMRGLGLLLAGDKGSGKSTLALALAERGARYLADEVSFIHYDDRRLEAFPKAATIKSGAFALFPETKTHRDLLRGPLRYLRPLNTAPLGFSTTAEVLIFPAWSKDQEGWALDPLARPEVALELIVASFGGLERDPRMAPLIRDLSLLPAFRLRYATGGEAFAAVDRLLEELCIRRLSSAC